MAKSTTGNRASQARFPLTRRADGRWCKKIHGQMFYFVGSADEALEEWLRVKDHLLADRDPPPRGEYVDVGELVNQFLHHKKQKIECGELAERTWGRYEGTGKMLIEFLGRTTCVANLALEDFQKLRAHMAKRWGPVALGNEIQIVRSIFRYGRRNGLLDADPKFGDQFDKPSAKTLRMERAKSGPKLFTAKQIKAVLKLARPAMKAMILLGINGGMGNTDVATLTAAAFDLDGGWLDYPREKTGMPRRIPLWPETVTAVRNAIKSRVAHKDPEAAELLFIGARGEDYVGRHKGSRVATEFAGLLKAAKIEGRSFYDLRRTFQTIAEEKSHDLVAVKAIMGHAPAAGDMSAVYRQRVTDERLRAVADGVRGWLY